MLIRKLSSAFLIGFALFIILYLVILPARAQDTVVFWGDPLRVKLFKTATMPQTVINTKDYIELYCFELPPGKGIKLTWVNLVTTWTAYSTFEDNSSAFVKSSGWVPGAGQAKFENGNFLYIATKDIPTNQTLSLTQNITQPSRFELWSERHPTHAPYTVIVTPATGGTYSQTIDPRPRTTPVVVKQDSDYQRGAPSFVSQVLPVGLNKITISTSGQMVVDKITLSRPVVTEQ